MRVVICSVSLIPISLIPCFLEMTGELYATRRRRGRTWHALLRRTIGTQKKLLRALPAVMLLQRRAASWNKGSALCSVVASC